MGKTSKLTQAEQVNNYLSALQHPLKPILEHLRKTIPTISPMIEAQIKWNSLSFHYTGEIPNYDPKTYQRDLFVCNLNKQEHVLLVFPTGANIKDPTNLLEGKFPDSRKVISISDQDDMHAKESGLQQIIQILLSQFPA